MPDDNAITKERKRCSQIMAFALSSPSETSFRKAHEAIREGTATVYFERWCERHRQLFDPCPKHTPGTPEFLR